MNKQIDDGGPAFPWDSSDAMGMSLRDWFAGLAMQVLIINPNGKNFQDRSIDA